MVKDGAFSHKIHNVTIFQEIQNLKGFQVALLVQKLWQFCLMSAVCLLVELHREGSAPTACAAGLF